MLPQSKILQSMRHLVRLFYIAFSRAILSLTKRGHCFVFSSTGTLAHLFCLQNTYFPRNICEQILTDRNLLNKASLKSVPKINNAYVLMFQYKGKVQ